MMTIESGQKQQSGWRDEPRYVRDRQKATAAAGSGGRAADRSREGFGWPQAFLCLWAWAPVGLGPLCGKSGA